MCAFFSLQFDFCQTTNQLFLLLCSFSFTILFYSGPFVVDHNWHG
ncbi:hypothetical protein Pint_10873 [Pistacia integerrima]|uniref:Uncharacterized protein n=1 Tax=Pistacia integerrima TaxID=434235 RepID=A0ACC0XGD1_9ROSI|nr:hypothetical protein Pint_10873 [Pistacia integerrima]